MTKKSTNQGYSRWWFNQIGSSLTPRWMGVTVVKHPIDLFQYQTILYDTKPDLLIETGTFAGGSALFFANMFDLIGNGRVVSVDLAQEGWDLPDHERIDFYRGLSSTDPQVIEIVKDHAKDKRCMVVLDSAHNEAHVLDELNKYAQFVAKGCYLIVEDSNRDGYKLAPGDIGTGGGPAEAIKRWQPKNRGFVQDMSCEQMGFTQNPGGFLKRVR